MNYCYIPQREIDGPLAVFLQYGDNAAGQNMAATLRGLYDEALEKDPTREKLDFSTEESTKNSFNKLFAFKRELDWKHNDEYRSKGATLQESYAKLKKEIPPQSRQEKAQTIANLFSQIVDVLEKRNPQFTREQILNGIPTNNGVRFGQLFIFDQVFKALANQQATLASKSSEEHTKVAEEIHKVLTNWHAMVTLAKRHLNLTEGISLRNTSNLVELSGQNSYTEDYMSIEEDLEESTKESWNSGKSTISLYGNVNARVKRFLSTIPQMELVDSPNGGKIAVPKRGSMGYILNNDPITVYNKIRKLTLGCTSESQFLDALVNKSGVAKQPWLIPIVASLKVDNRMLTSVYTSMKANFQLYGLTLPNKAKSKKGFIKYRSKIINRLNNTQYESFTTRLALSIPINRNTSVFRENGTVNKENLIETYNKIKDFLDKKSQGIYSEGGALNALYNGSSQIIDILHSLGIDITKSISDDIMSDEENLNELSSLFEDLLKWGFNQTLFKSLSDESKYINVVSKSNSSTESRFMQVFRKINDLITKADNTNKFETKVRYRNPKGDNVTMHSDVLPSFMGDRFDEIHSYVRENDKEGLKKYLEVTYLSNPIFKQDGVILNKWIEELYNCCNRPETLKNSFAEEFTYLRLLGSTDKSFEDFNGKFQMIDMLTQFNSDREVNDQSDTAFYPVFILGDSGVCKYIRAKRYDSKEEIINSLYKVYKQELRRQELVKGINKWCEDRGYSKIKNFSTTENTFSILKFFNEPKYSNLLSNPSEKLIKEAIEKELYKDFEEFYSKLDKLGILKPRIVEGEYRDYVYFGEGITNENIRDHLLDYYLNNKLAMINQLQLFTIDPSFYSSSKDLQKRYKEIHASGKSLNVEARKSNGELYSENGIETCIYFNEIEVNAEETNPDFMEVIANTYGKDSIIYQKYKKNALTDGQGYRTLGSYIKVMGMAGENTTRMEAAYDKIKEIRSKYATDIYGRVVEEISNADLKAIEDIAVIFQPIKPFLFSHEEIPINSEQKFLNPVQHKYAEAVLIPELLPDGKLRDLAYYMEEHGIDVACATSAVKVGSFGSVDISSSRSFEELSDSLKQGYVHSIKYKDYRIQNNVPVHNNGTRLIGTQLKKQIMAHIDSNKDYSHYLNKKTVTLGKQESRQNQRLNGRNLITFYNNLISADILESYEKFKKEILNPRKLSEAMINNVLANTRESLDMLQAVSLTNMDELALPLFEGGIEHDTVAYILSQFKEIVNKHKGVGGSAVQVSAMGINGYSEDNSLKFVTNKEKTNILYAECEMPFDLHYIDKSGNKIELKYDDYCNNDGTLIMTNEKNPDETFKSKLEVEFPKINQLVAYRIPTENAYSLLNLKVVRYSRKTTGGTIRVPAQGTTIAGFDFDIDKLYFMLRAFHETKDSSKDRRQFKEYNTEKTALENSRVARNNMLIDLIQARLSDPETLINRTTPGGFPKSAKAARFMREIMFGKLENGIDRSLEEYFDRNSENNPDPEPNYDPTDPYTMIVYNQQNQVASKLIGVFANHNTNYSFASLMDTFKLKYPIKFAEHSFDDLLHNKNSEVTSNMAELLAASVDAVKDPVLNFLNLNLVTADTAALLVRLGYSPKEVGLLLNQPIIREVCELAQEKGYTLSMAIAELETYYENIPANSDVDTSVESLIKYIVNYRQYEENGKKIMYENSRYIEDQLGILSLFREISSIATSVSDFIASTRFTASNSVGSTIGELYAQQMKVSKYLESLKEDSSPVIIKVTETLHSPVTNGQLIENSEEYLESLWNNPFGFEQAMFDANRRLLKDLSSIFPYENDLYSYSRKFMANLTKAKQLDAKTINKIHQKLLVNLLANMSHSNFNGRAMKKIGGNRKAMEAREYYLDVFPRDLAMHLGTNPYLKSSPLFQNLVFSLNEDTNKLEMYINNVASQDVTHKDAIREDWEDLFLDEDFRGMAEDLFYYNFHKNGFNFSLKSFMHLAPTALKLGLTFIDNNGKSISYVDFLNAVKGTNGFSEFGLNMEAFAKQFVLNNSDNYRFCFNATKSSLSDYLKEKMGLNSEVSVQRFELDMNSLGVRADRFLIDKNTSDNIFSWIPAIKLEHNGKSYIYIAEKLGNQIGSKMTYTKANLSDNIVYEGDNFGKENIEDIYVDTTNYKKKTPTVTSTSNLFGFTMETNQESRRLFEKIAERMKAEGLSENSIETIKNTLTYQSREYIENLYKRIEEEGLNKVLDADGNELPLCG